MTRRPRRLGLLLSGILVAALLVVGVPGLTAALAPPDVPTPAGADALAQDIQRSLASEMELRVPAYRVAIRGWEQVGLNSYLVSVEVYDLLFGLGSRRALVAAPCWSPGRAYSAGWADDVASEGEVRASFQDGAKACP